MAIDDTGRWRKQCGDAVQFRFEPPRLGSIETFDIVNAIGEGCGGNLLEGRNLRVIGSNDDFAHARVSDAVVAAIGVEPPAPPAALDAGRRFQTLSWVVDAAVDDLAVARRGLGADWPGAVEHHNLVA